MLKKLKVASLCVLIALAGCATGSPEQQRKAAEDPLDKTKTGAVIGAAAATAPVLPLCFIPVIGWGICASSLIYGAAIGGGTGAGVDYLEQQSAPPAKPEAPHSALDKPFVGYGS